MPRNRSKKRRGSANLVEMIAAIAILAIMLRLTMPLLSIGLRTGIDTTEKCNVQADMDYLVEALQADVKSAERVEVDDGKIHILNGNTLTVYWISANGTLYRDNERVISNIETGMVVPGDESTIGLYLVFADGSVFDFTFTR